MCSAWGALLSFPYSTYNQDWSFTKRSKYHHQLLPEGARRRKMARLVDFGRLLGLRTCDSSKHHSPGTTYFVHGPVEVVLPCAMRCDRCSHSSQIRQILSGGHEDITPLVLRVVCGALLRSLPRA